MNSARVEDDSSWRSSSRRSESPDIESKIDSKEYPSAKRIYESKQDRVEKQLRILSSHGEDILISAPEQQQQSLGAKISRFREIVNQDSQGSDASETLYDV